MHCPDYPPRVDIEAQSADRIYLGSRLWNISSPGAALVVSTNSGSRFKRSTIEGTFAECQCVEISDSKHESLQLALLNIIVSYILSE